MKLLIASLIVAYVPLVSAEVVSLDDYRKVQTDTIIPTKIFTPRGSVSTLKMAQMKRKYESILGVFAGPDLYNLKLVLEQVIDKIPIVLTRISLKESDGEIKLDISHWIEGRVETSVLVPLERLEAKNSFTEKNTLYEFETIKGEETKIYIEGLNKETDLYETKLRISSVDSEHMEFNDKILNETSMFKKALLRIDRLPMFAEGTDADLSTLLSFGQLQLQSKKIVSEVSMTDFLKGHFSLSDLNRCALAFN